MSPIVIILTNYPYPQHRKKCMEERADFFLDKSTEFEKIIEIFKCLLRGLFFHIKIDESCDPSESLLK